MKKWQNWVENRCLTSNRCDLNRWLSARQTTISQWDMYCRQSWTSRETLKGAGLNIWSIEKTHAYCMRPAAYSSFVRDKFDTKRKNRFCDNMTQHMGTNRKEDLTHHVNSWVHHYIFSLRNSGTSLFEDFF